MANRSSYIYTEQYLRAQPPPPPQQQQPQQQQALRASAGAASTPVPAAVGNRYVRVPVTVETERGGKKKTADVGYMPSAYMDPFSKHVIVKLHADKLAALAAPDSSVTSECSAVESDQAADYSQWASDETEHYATARPIPAAANASMYCYKTLMHKPAEPQTADSAKEKEKEVSKPGPAAVAAPAPAAQKVPSYYVMELLPPAYRHLQLQHFSTKPVADKEPAALSAHVAAEETQPPPVADTMQQERAPAAAAPPQPQRIVPPPTAAAGAQAEAARDHAQTPAKTEAHAPAPINSCYMMDVVTAGGGDDAGPVQHAAVAQAQQRDQPQPQQQQQQRHSAQFTAAPTVVARPPPAVSAVGEQQQQQSMYADQVMRDEAANYGAHVPQTQPQPQRSAKPPPPQQQAAMAVAPQRGRQPQPQQWAAAVESVYMQPELDQWRQAGRQAAAGDERPHPVVWTGGSGSGHTLVAHAQVVRTVSGVALNEAGGSGGTPATRVTSSRGVKRHREPEHVAHAEAIRVATGH